MSQFVYVCVYAYCAGQALIIDGGAGRRCTPTDSPAYKGFFSTDTSAVSCIGKA